MPRVSRWPLEKEDLLQIREDFLAALTLLENKKEVRQFLQRFLTPDERVMLAKRFQLIMLIVAEWPKDEIHNALHVSYDTIARMGNKLQDGENTVLVEVAEKILELREEIALQRRDRFHRKSISGDLATPLAKEGVKQLGKAWFAGRKRRSVAK